MFGGVVAGDHGREDSVGAALDQAQYPRLRERGFEIRRRPSLVDRRFRRHRPLTKPARQPFHPSQQRAHDFLIGPVRKQGQGHHVVNHQPRWQQPIPLLQRPSARDHRIHHIGRENPRQHAKRNVITQSFGTLRGHPSTTCHAQRLTHMC